MERAREVRGSLGLLPTGLDGLTSGLGFSGWTCRCASPLPRFKEGHACSVRQLGATMPLVAHGVPIRFHVVCRRCARRPSWRGAAPPRCTPTDCWPRWRRWVAGHPCKRLRCSVSTWVCHCGPRLLLMESFSPRLNSMLLLQGLGDHLGAVRKLNRTRCMPWSLLTSYHACQSLFIVAGPGRPPGRGARAEPRHQRNRQRSAAHRDALPAG